MAVDVGFIGLGIMCAPMAAILMRASNASFLPNRTAAEAAPLVQAGATMLEGPREVAQTRTTLRCCP
jgi:3-hydroxyisobutyrate dehydrogenase-like beta-hydroxyacid dehydrogenase